jgi:hypothetical protein
MLAQTMETHKEFQFSNENRMPLDADVRDGPSKGKGDLIAKACFAENAAHS